MKKYLFSVYCTGLGDNEEEAIQSAIDDLEDCIKYNEIKDVIKLEKELPLEE